MNLPQLNGFPRYNTVGHHLHVLDRERRMGPAFNDDGTELCRHLETIAVSHRFHRKLTDTPVVWQDHAYYQRLASTERV